MRIRTRLPRVMAAIAAGMLGVGVAIPSQAARPAASLSIEGVAEFAGAELGWRTYGGFDVPELAGCSPAGPVGYPELPQRSYSYLIPEGYQVTGLQVTAVESAEDPARRRILPVAGEDSQRTGPVPDPAAYSSTAEYPGQPVSLVGTGTYRGERIAQVLYNPVGYRPSDGRVTLYRRVEFSLTLAPAAGGALMRPLRESAKARTSARRFIADLVENPPAAPDAAGGGAEGIADFAPFRPTEFPSLDGSLVEYVIIAPDQFAANFQPLADWKTQCGTTAVVRTLSWIDANYPAGSDRQDRIRAFIQDAYSKWGTQFVLLGGDTEFIPTRYCHLRYYYVPDGEYIPTDLFYAALDGSWNNDGDGDFGEGYSLLWGELGDSVDLYPEVFVGRAPVNDATDISTFIAKNIAYRKTPVPLNQKKAAFVAEVLFPYGWSPPPGPGNEIFLNGCELGHEAAAFVGGGWDTVHVCEWPDQDMNHASVVSALNQGYGLVSVITHGDAFKVSTSDGKFFRINDVQALTNNNRFSVLYYSNCNTSQFDAECLNEAWLFNPTGGAVASIGPARLEFPTASSIYTERFYQGFFRRGIDLLGELHEAHMVPSIPAAGSDGTTRWVHLAQTLLGDPELRIWRNLPDSLTMSHGGSMTLADSLYTVTVLDGVDPVVRATVVLWNPATGDYARGLTGAAGQITLAFRPSAAGSAKLTAWHPDYRTRETTVTVTGGAGRVRVTGLVVDDDASGLSSGNGDGRADAGERIELGVTLKNEGSTSASSVDGTLLLPAGRELTLDVLQDLDPWPQHVHIGASGASPASLPVTLALAGDTLAAWGRPLYTWSAAADSGAWFWQDASGWHLRVNGGLTASAFRGSVTTDGSVLAAKGFRLESTDTLTFGGGTIQFAVTVDSTDAEDGFDFVIGDSTHVSLLIDTANYGTLAPGASDTQYFLLELAADAPDQHQARMQLAVTGTPLAATTWPEGLRLEIGAPDLLEEYHAVNDSTFGGDKDGFIDVGETVVLWPRAANRGHATAIGVQATLRPITGITIADSTETFGDIAPGALVAGTGGFRLTSNSGTMQATLELRDAAGRSWSETLDLGVPAAPISVTSTATAPLVANGVDLRWSESPSPDAWGYNVYRSADSAGTYARVNPHVVQNATYYLDTTVNPHARYFYRVATVDSAGNESARSAIHATRSRPPYQAGWPQVAEGAIWGSPIVVDLREGGAEDLEVIVGGLDGQLYVWSAAGALMPGWPKFCGDELWSSPAVGNFDPSDDALEIIVGSNDKNIYAFNHDGTGLLAPSGIFYTTQAQVRGTPVLADLDANGDLEMLVGNSNGRLFAFNHNGSAFLASAAVDTTVGGIVSGVTVADLDNNGDLEILVPTLGGRVYAYNHDGSGFLAPSQLFYNVGSGLWGSVAVGDTDGDGFMDVVGAAYNGRVYRWNRNGVLQAGWPQLTDQDGNGGDQDIWGAPVLGDLNGDGNLDVMVGTSDAKAYAWRWDGTAIAGWPVTLPDSTWSSPVLADVNGDGSPDAVFAGMDASVHAYKSNGQRVEGWPLPMTDRTYGSAAAVVDLDLDGDVEVLMGGYEGRIYCWDLATPWNRLASPWPVYGHDTYRTSWIKRPYTDVPGEGAQASLPASYALQQNVPNPFNPRTVIRFALPKDGEASLAVFDVAGRRVKTLVSGRQTAGYHEAVWLGADEEGREVASGVYFYRLEAGDRTFSEKMILLR